jgi:hypothetical protein
MDAPRRRTFVIVERRINRRQQGDLGEASAIEWLTRQGAVVFTPLGHSPDVDLVACFGSRLVRIEVKTSAHRDGARWTVGIATAGGNQSWSGLVKHFDPARCDYLFAHVADGRRWLLPTAAIDSARSITLGGPKYSEYEIEPGAPFDPGERLPLVECATVPGEYRSGQTGCAVNALAQSFVGSNPASPTVATHEPVKPTRRERSLGRSGQAVINQKRRLTIPQRAFFEAGLQNGSRVRVRADGPGRIIAEQIGLPAWAPPRSTPQNDEGPRPSGPSGCSSPFES